MDRTSLNLTYHLLILRSEASAIAFAPIRHFCFGFPFFLDFLVLPWNEERSVRGLSRVIVVLLSVVLSTEGVCTSSSV
jgi:hypothetical protein